MLACVSRLMPDQPGKGPPSSAPLSVEDADRLAESFTPFWEDDDLPAPAPAAVAAACAGCARHCACACAHRRDASRHAAARCRDRRAERARSGLRRDAAASDKGHEAHAARHGTVGRATRSREPGSRSREVFQARSPIQRCSEPTAAAAAQPAPPATGANKKTLLGFSAPIVQPPRSPRVRCQRCRAPLPHQGRSHIDSGYPRHSQRARLRHRIHAQGRPRHAAGSDRARSSIFPGGRASPAVADSAIEGARRTDRDCAGRAQRQHLRARRRLLSAEKENRQGRGWRARGGRGVARCGARDPSNVWQLNHQKRPTTSTLPSALPAATPATAAAAEAPPPVATSAAAPVVAAPVVPTPTAEPTPPVAEAPAPVDTTPVRDRSTCARSRGTARPPANRGLSPSLHASASTDAAPCRRQRQLTPEPATPAPAPQSGAAQECYRPRRTVLNSDSVFAPRKSPLF